jgi:hypothetical protein
VLRVRVLVLLFVLLAVGCVERKLYVRTEPAGAMVEVNGREVGRTPIAWSFDHYGTVRVNAHLEGHHAVEQEYKLKVPWYQRPFLDFFADVLWPGTIHNDHDLDIKMKPVPERTKAEDMALAAEVAARATKLRDRKPLGVSSGAKPPRNPKTGE